MSHITIVSADANEWIEAAMAYMPTETQEKKEEYLDKIKQFYQGYDLPQNWEKLMALRKKYPHSPFLFAKREVIGNKTLFNADIINIAEVTWTLQKHYFLFSKELGIDFDPLEVTLEFEDPKSAFWNQIFNNPLLQGVLYGYGERNAYFFSKQLGQYQEIDHCLFKSHISTNDEKAGISLKDLRLPSFRSYDLPCGQDPTIVQYEQERRVIQQQLQHKDFTEEAFNKLFGCCS